jgi:hypothetical protein
METKNYNCIICLEPITNPVCIECYLKEINSWLQENIENKITRQIILLSIINKIPKTPFKKDLCILCGKNEVTTCSYCFFLKTLEILKKLELSRETMNSFKETFNYSLGHAEYHI